MTEKLEKNTVMDRRNLLQKALYAKFEDQPYLMDFDDNFLYFERWNPEAGYSDYKVGYSITDMVNVEIDDNVSKVVRLTEYKEVEEDIDKSLFKKVEDFILKNFGSKLHPVVKQFDEEEMIAIEPLYIAVGEVDGHGDTIDSIEEMESLVKSFNEANEAGILQSSFFHKHKTDKFKVMKAWVNQVDCMIGDSLVPEGQPIVKIKFNDEKAWNLRKQGVFGGVSIGAIATAVEELE